jgi:hypothetical protein
MNMEECMWLAVTVIGITAAIKTWILVSRRNNSSVSNANRGNQSIVQIGGTSRSATETGPMVYYANDTHGRRDKEYRFNYKKVNGSWRAYILRMPSLGNRSTDGHATHRLWDGTKPYVCWDSPVHSLSDIQTISRVWADNIQEYIATGKRFG